MKEMLVLQKQLRKRFAVTGAAEQLAVGRRSMGIPSASEPAPAQDRNVVGRAR